MMDKRTLRSRKGKPRNARPYDHQNQSIFGRVYSTVRGWLFNVPQWISISDQEKPEGSSDEVEEEIIREDNDIVSQSLSHGNKRLRLRYEDRVPSIQNSGTQTWCEQPSDALFETISLAQSPETQTSLLDNKETLTVLNGDDHSENSEGSASTSGCSSLISSHKENNRLPGSTFANLLETKNRKRKEPSKCEFSDLNSSRNLWSSRISSPSKFHRRPPTVSHTNQPSFKLSSFGGPSKLNESVEKTISSPFYEGRTTFGGASAFRRMPPSVTPYNVDKTLRNQIKTRDQNLEDNLEGMSSAAKRILLTLEKMSTPIADAKKIPNSDKSPVDLSLYLTPPKSRRNSQFTPSVSSKGPPIANINTIAKFASLKNFGASRLQTTLQSSPVTSVASKPQTSESAQPVLPETSSLKSGGGKMKMKLNQQHQPSRAANAENELGYDLPSLKSVPLQISTLPMISFGLKQDKTSAPPVGGFTFSNPIQHELSISNSVPASSECQSSLPHDSFKFSSPIEHELPSSNNIQPKEKSLKSWESNDGWVRNSEKESFGNVPFVSETSKVSKEDNTAKVTSAPVASQGNFEFSSCWGRNPVNESKCETPKTTKEKISAESTSAPIPKTKETWECSSCWVRNPVNESKCIACETPKSVEDKKSETKTSSVARAFSSWECSSCWVRNPISEKKCMACETLHPSADEKSGFTFKGANASVAPVMSSKASSQSIFTGAKVSSTSAAASFGNFVFSTATKDTTPTSSVAGSGSGFSFKGLTKPETTAAASSAASQSVSSGPSLSTTAAPTAGGFVFASTKTETQTTATAPFSFGSGSGFNFKALAKPESSVAASQSKISDQTPAASVFAVSKTEALNTTPASSAAASPGFIFKGLGNKPEATAVSSAVSQSTTSSPSLNTSAAPPTGGFVFATTKTETQTTPAPFSFGSSSALTTQNPATEKVLSSKDTWECSSCWVKNPLKESKCMACESPKTTADKSASTSSTPLMTSSSKDTWECSGCWVRNPAKESKCMACETPKTTDANKSGFTTEGFGKPETVTAISSAASQSTSSVPIISASTPAPSGNFVFATPNTESKNTTSAMSSGFSFKGLNKAETAAISLTASPLTTSGPNLNTTAAVPFGGFAFAATKTDAQSTSTAPFTVFNMKSGSKPQPTTTVLSSAASQSTTSGLSSTAPMSAGGFVFASSKQETQNAAPAPFAVASNSGFSFKGLTKPETTAAASSAASQSVSSGPSLSTTAAPTSAGFVFASTKTETQTTAPAPFSFGSGSGFTFKTENPQTTPAVSSTTQAASSSAGLGTSAPFSSGGFVFRAAKTEAPSAISASFSFGSGSSNPSAFSGTHPVASTFQGNATGGFNFGAASSGVFQFGASSNISAAANPQASGGFVFKTPKVEAAQPAPFSFGSGASMPGVTSVLSGNNPVAQSFEAGTDKPATSGFNFATSSIPVFQFGSSNNNNAEKKRPAGFSFGTPAAQETTTNSFPQSFNMNTPPSFNFGASSTPAAGPFQFAASSAPRSAPAQNATRKYRKAVRRVKKD